MSAWTYVDGLIKVDVMGSERDERQALRVVKQLLPTLPRVTGDEEDMGVYPLLINGTNVSHYNERKQRTDAWQTGVLLTLYGSLRHRELTQTVVELGEWLTALRAAVLISRAHCAVTNHLGVQGDLSRWLKEGTDVDYTPW